MALSGIGNAFWWHPIRCLCFCWLALRAIDPISVLAQALLAGAYLKCVCLHQRSS
jgi:hypothetical protein